jgi:hypothetical protein
MDINQELKTLYEKDINERNSIDWDHASSTQIANLRKKDKKRKEKVLALINEGKVKSAQDYHHAALIFQHGESTNDFKKAHELATKAVALGDESARWLFAATLDRYLISMGKPQKYGTQFKLNNNGEWELGEPIDPTVTDKERAKYNVPPLSQALQRYKEKYGIKP